MQFSRNNNLNPMRPIDHALHQFAAKGYTAHDLREEKTTVQFTLTGETPLDTDLLGKVMSDAFPECIYAFAANSDSTTVKILI